MADRYKKGELDPKSSRSISNIAAHQQMWPHRKLHLLWFKNPGHGSGALGASPIPQIAAPGLSPL
jgi:hypothetical protein